MKKLSSYLALLLFCTTPHLSFAAEAEASTATEKPPQEISLADQETQAAEDGPAIATLVFYFENDLFYSTDRYYTNAVQFRAISPPLRSLKSNKIFGDSLDGLMGQAEDLQDDTLQYNMSVGMGQIIFTPDDTDARELQKDDRPYAGHLYGFIALHAKQQHMMDTAELALGIVGPSALGENAQNGIHRLRNLDTANGWNNQLHDEPTLMLTWTRNYRLNPDAVNSGWTWDILPYHSVSVGNVLTQAAVGSEVRWGWNLPGSFATSQIRPGSGIDAPATGFLSPKREKAPTWGWYLFGGMEGNAVAHNIFLDGNTWRDSHSIDKRPLVGELNIGMAVIYEGMRISYNHVYRTKEFYGQKSEQNFGSITLAIPF